MVEQTDVLNYHLASVGDSKRNHVPAFQGDGAKHLSVEALEAPSV